MNTFLTIREKKHAFNTHTHTLASSTNFSKNINRGLYLSTVYSYKRKQNVADKAG